MYKPDTKSQRAKWAAGPIGSIEIRITQARKWMSANGIKPIEHRESFDDVHATPEPERRTIGNIRLPGVIR